MLLNNITPSAALADYIRQYVIVDFKFSHDALIPFKVYPPRPEHCLQFYPKDTETVKYTNTELSISGKRCALVGQHTIVNNRYVGKNFLLFQVIFQPGALYRLTGIPSVEFSNQYMDAEDVLGKGVELVNEQLFEASNYNDMVLQVEKFLLQLIKNLKKQQHAVDKIGKLMIYLKEPASIDWLAKEACLCHRQLDRKFSERVGISPKYFDRVIRFDRAFRMKNKFPAQDWLTIALQCGYYDYQHLAKDYKEFTGCTPALFFEIDNRAPERSFGEAEL